jgi:two-component system cell cycle response regulator
VTFGDSEAAQIRPAVLVVDAVEDVHRVLRAGLGLEEVEVVSARTGAEGLDAALRHCPAAVLLDLELPDMSGRDVLVRLKDDARTGHLPVIILSAAASPRDKADLFELGAHDYVPKPFDMVELRMRVRAAVRLQRLLEWLSKRAQIDGLTGLWNRAYFDRRFPEEVARAARHAYPLSLAMIDIDHFKSINDTYGHPAGDAVLQGIGAILLRECRQSDIACRYGGEEIAIVMTDTCPGDARVLCDRLRRSILEATWRRLPGREVTVSVGVAGTSARTDVAVDQWIDAADQSLYGAKRGGRNRVNVVDFTGSVRWLARAG